MDNSANLPTPELPTPSPEKGADGKQFEQLVSIEKVNQQPTVMVNPLSAAIPSPIIPPSQTPATQPTFTQGQSTPVIADDVDVIEKEWVKKAKDIVEQTKEDPFVQNKQLNEFKATYIKKRYNKDIKLADG